MAKVLLLSLAGICDDGSDYNRGAFLSLRHSASIDSFRQHHLTDDPDAADLILFAELYGAGPYFESVRSHSFVKRFREKCFLFCSNDFVIPLLPGVYASIERRWSSVRTRSGSYLGVFENEFVELTPPADNLKYLCSFVGNAETARVRRELCKLSHPRSLFLDTSAEYPDFLHKRLTENQVRDYQRRYADICKASKFILCPRGMGASSVRLFDTMRMGRVPLILSDQWVPPVGPCWEKFSLRVPEREVATIPTLVEDLEDQFVEMAKLARTQWEEWFSERVYFHRVVESCLDIKRRRRIPERFARFSVYIQFPPLSFLFFFGRNKRGGGERERRTPVPGPQRAAHRMKILFSSYTFSPNVGGIESVSAILAEKFASAGHEVKLITETPDETITEKQIPPYAPAVILEITGPSFLVRSFISKQHQRAQSDSGLAPEKTRDRCPSNMAPKH